MKTRVGPAISADVRKQLSSAQLVSDFGIRSSVAHRTVDVFHRFLSLPDFEPFVQWQQRFGQVEGGDLQQFSSFAVPLACRYGVLATSLNPAALWFALQSYYAAVVRLLVRRFVSWDVDDLPGGNPFLWCFAEASKAIVRQVDELTAVMHACDTTSWSDSMQSADIGSEGDLLKALYQDLFPRRLRHRLGEYYTPDWLARHVLDQVSFTGDPGQRLLDPACGSGTFLVLALRRGRTHIAGIRDWGLGIGNRQHSDPWSSVCHPQSRIPGSSSPAPCPSPLSCVVGCDVNPLAVLTARANYVIALHDLLPKDAPVEIPVYLADSILDPPRQPAFAEPFDFVVGNPPWIAWDNLPAEYRQASRPLWQQYGLFSLSANAARHGGGKKDLSMLMLYTSADRYLKPGGRLGMVMTQTLFQTKGAGDGFRQFRLGSDGAPLKVLRVDDMSALRPFEDASNWTSTIVLSKGEETKYPVPYYVWEEDAAMRDNRQEIASKRLSNNLSPLPLGEGPGVRAGVSELQGHASSTSEKQIARDAPIFRKRQCLAEPVVSARPGSPWLVRPVGAPMVVPSQSGPSDYVAHLGANSGGANGVYWLEVLGPADGGVLVRNLAAKAKHGIETVEQVIEPDLLYPLVRWSDVKRYSAAPSCHILLAQDAVARTGIKEAVMRERYPRTLAYLERFRDLLTTRAAYRRYQHGGPFYSMYNIGPYTLSPIKVVWRRMDRRINAAVVETMTDPVLGRRPVVPQETCVLIACDSSDEAHYLCAILNSEPLNQRVAAHSVRNGKGFGTPGMLEFLGVRNFDPGDPHHQELVALSRQAHFALLVG